METYEQNKIIEDLRYHILHRVSHLLTTAWEIEPKDRALSERVRDISYKILDGMTYAAYQSNILNTEDDRRG